MQRQKVLPTGIQCLSFATSLTSMTAYFLLHVGIQDRNLGDLPIFLQHFAKPSKVENLDTEHKENVNM